MNNLEIPELNQEQPLQARLQHILANTCLDSQRLLIRTITDKLGADILDCAAALVYLTENSHYFSQPPVTAQTVATPPGIKMVRYRLDIGSQHQVTLEAIKKALVDESGVDKNNITNVSIRGLYTLIDLPDAMPPDIFQHLKSVEINQQKLAIKRVKPRNKKRGAIPYRRGKTRHPKSDNRLSDQAGNKSG